MKKLGEKVKFNPNDFPHLSKDVLQEAAKPLPRKYLDILIGNPNLPLQPVCQTVPRVTVCIDPGLELDMSL